MPAIRDRGAAVVVGEEDEGQRELVGRVGHHVTEAPEQLGGAVAREDREAPP